MGAENFLEGDSPLGGKESSGGVTEAAKEVFRENLKKSQAATKQIKKDEGKQQAYNSGLATLVAKLLQNGGYDFIVLLIADLVEANVPSDLILAVLSLEFDDAYAQAVNNASQFATEETKKMIASHALIPFAAFSENLQSQLAEWGERVIHNALKEPVEVLETIIHTDTWKVHPSLIGLTTILIQRFAMRNNISVLKESIDQFSEQFFEKLQNVLQEYMASQPQLKSS